MREKSYLLRRIETRSFLISLEARMVLLPQLFEADLGLFRFERSITHSMDYSVSERSNFRREIR